jgi:hypothetical protein
MILEKPVAPIHLSGAYLRRLEPVRTAFLGLVTYLILALVAPLRSTVADPSTLAVAYALACYLALAVGAILFHTLFPQKPAARDLWAAPLPKPLFLVALGLSGLGVAMRMTDRFILRGVPLGEDFASVRAQLEATSASPLSAASAVIYPICFGMIFFYYCLPKTERRWWLGALATLIFLYPSFESIISGTRSQMAVSLGFILVTRSILVDDLKWLRNRLVVAAAGILILNLFFLMFEIRVESMGQDFYTSSQNSGYAFTVPPNDFALSYLVENKGIMTSIVSLIVHFTQYYCHSGFEYLYIFDRLPEKPLWGAFNFFHIYKFFGMVVGDSSVNETINNLDIRVGVYATFFVPLFIDYHWGGPVFMMIFGFVLSLLWRATFRHPTAWFPLTGYMSIVLFLMPITSFIVASQGLYVITALLAMGVLIHRMDGSGRRLTAGFRKAQ